MRGFICYISGHPRVLKLTLDYFCVGGKINFSHKEQVSKLTIGQSPWSKFDRLTGFGLNAWWLTTTHHEPHGITLNLYIPLIIQEEINIELNTFLNCLISI